MDVSGRIKHFNFDLKEIILNSTSEKTLILKQVSMTRLDVLVAEIFNISVEDLPLIHERVNTLTTNKFNTDNFSNELSAILPIFGKTDREGFLVKSFYNFVDSDYRFLQEYLAFIDREIRPLFPNEERLLIQRTPNIRFHVPGNIGIGTLEKDPAEDIHGLHCDSEFGHPPFEINIIVPITEMYESNSLWYEKDEGQDIEFFESLRLNKKEFFVGYLNRLRHFNRINRTNHTRISLDFRVVPQSSFYISEAVSCTRNNKFLPGDYYMLF